MVRDAAKTLARGLAAVAVAPAVVWFVVIRRPLFGADRALEGSSQAFSLIPGLVGDYLRRAFLSRVLDRCASSATIQFGTIFSQTGARIDDNVYVGPRCHLGLVHLERDVLVGSGVHIPSGPFTHGVDAVDRPIREQPGSRRRVCIGEGTWIGSAAVVLADVGRHAVVGAGSVVTQAIPDYAIAAGVPAKVVRSRIVSVRESVAGARP